MCGPTAILVCDGSLSENENLLNLMIQQGTATKYDNCWLVKTDPKDVAMVESWKVISTERREQVIPNGLNPQKVKKYIAAFFPSAFDKTNVAMTTHNLHGWRVECVGDDITWMRFNNQTLKQADVTFGSLSESLRIYLEGISDSEPGIYSNWLSDAPFTARNPGRRTQIVSFLCNVLLQNKPPQIQEKVKLGPTDEELLIKNFSKDKWNHYHVLRDKKEIIDFGDSLLDKGVRERGLKSSLNGLNSVFSKKVPDFDDGGLNEMIDEDIDEDLVGVDPDLVYKIHQGLIETLEERVASACLQIKCWTLPLLRNQHHNGNLSQCEIIEIVKTRLLDLETAVERRYLKPPLGKSANELNLSNLVGEDNANALNTNENISNGPPCGSTSSINWLAKKEGCLADSLILVITYSKSTARICFTSSSSLTTPESSMATTPPTIATGSIQHWNPFETNPMATIFKDTLFTNTARTADGGVYWEGFHVPSNFEITSSTGELNLDINSEKPSAHPNSRFCSPAINCPNLDQAWENPECVPISAILFGCIWGMPEWVPLVYEAYDWTRGIYIGFSLCSEDKLLIWKKMTRHTRLRTIIKDKFEEIDALSWDLSLTDLMFETPEFNSLLDAFNIDNENRKTLEFLPWFTGCLVLYCPKVTGETLMNHIQSNWENSEAKIMFYHGKSCLQGPCKYLLGNKKWGEDGTAEHIRKLIEKGYTAVWIQGNRYNGGTTKENQALACAETFFNRLVSSLQAKTKVHKDKIKFHSINQKFL